MFLLTGLVCLVLAAVRATVELPTFDLPPTWDRALTMSVVQFAIFGVPIWATFSRNWFAGAIVSVASIAGVCFYEWTLVAGSALFFPPYIGAR